MGFKAKAAKPNPNPNLKPKPNPKPKAAKPTLHEDYELKKSDFDNPDHFRQYICYCHRLEACGPFDIDFLPDLSVGLFGLIYPCRYEYGAYREEVDKCVRHAIAYAKKEKMMELEDPKVVKANHQCHCGTMYYITFDAKDKRSGERQLYHAKVLFGINAYRRKHGIDVRLIRVKNSQKKSRGY